MNLALNVTFVGLVVVFLALIILSLIISLFLRVFITKNKSNADYTASTHDEASILEIEDDNESAAIHVVQSDDELIAVLTAAVMASLGNKAESNIRVKSFRRIPQNSPVWNTVSRKEQLASKL